MSNKIFRGHTISTTWHPIPELGNWPLDHVFVSTTDGMSWGCFGRGLSDEPNARVIAQAEGCLDWVTEIAGQITNNSVAGVTHQVNGICQNAANRLLLPAGIDVSDAPGNEIATSIFGKFGLGLSTFAQSVKDAAHRVNQRTPGLISEEMIARAVSKITHSKKEEIEILAEDLQDFLKINTKGLSNKVRAQLHDIYSELYLKRHATYAGFLNGKLSPDAYKASLRSNILKALENVKAVIGDAAFMTIFKLPPAVAAQYAVGCQ